MNTNNTLYKVTTHPEVSNAASRLYTFLFMDTQFTKKGYCDLSNKELKDTLHMAAGTITTAAKNLKDLGFIKQEDTKLRTIQGQFFTEDNGSQRRYYIDTDSKAIKKTENKLKTANKAFEAKFNKWWEGVILKDTKSISLKKLLKMSNTDREQVLITYKVLQSKEKEGYRTKLSNFIGQLKYQDESNQPEYLKNGQKTEAEKKEEQMKRHIDMMKDDTRTIIRLVNAQNKNVDTDKLLQWVKDMYKEKTYNKVTAYIKKLENN